MITRLQGYAIKGYGPRITSGNRFAVNRSSTWLTLYQRTDYLPVYIYTRRIRTIMQREEHHTTLLRFLALRPKISPKSENTPKKCLESPLLLIA